MIPFCCNNFWDWDISWNTQTFPDFTICFEESVLIWIPCLIFWMLSLSESLFISNKYYKTIYSWDFIESLKIFLAFILFVLNVIEFVSNFTGDSQESNASLIDFISPFVKSITFIYFIHRLQVHHKYSYHSSAAVFIFWLLLTIGTTFNYRTIITLIFTDNDKSVLFLSETKFIIKILSYPIILTQFILSCFSNYSYENLNTIQKKTSPEKYVSFISQMTFNWFNSMVIKGRNRTLTTNDLWDLDVHNLSNYIINKFNKIWLPLLNKKKLFENEMKSKTKNHIKLIGPLLKTFWLQMFFVSLIKLMASSLVFISPLVLDSLLSFMNPNNTEPYWRGYFYALIMFVALMIESILNNQYEYQNNLLAMRIRATIISVIYNKTLKLSSCGRKSFTSGEIVNLMSVDCQRVIDFFLMVNFVWSAPLQITIVLILLWQQLGIATLAGLAFLVILLPFNSYMANIVRSFQSQQMKFKDQRVKLMSEILNGIKVLKLYAWEQSFMDRLLKIRENEVKSLNKAAIYQGAITFSFVSAHFFVGLVSFGTYVFISPDNILNPNKAFVSLSLFNLMRLPLGYIPVLLSMSALYLVSLNRIDDFLNADEIDENSVFRENNANIPIIINSATFSWSKDCSPLLKDLSLFVKPKQLVAIVGQVGAGKSSLLSAILGEMEILKGTVGVSGKIAYVSQEAWIQNKTIKQNILFNETVNERFYNKVLESCDLTNDLKVLMAGDMTEIGEKGINLSGGQKQRVSLARALYSNADIYLLDDPLSAVDTHVGRHLFNKAIGPKGMLKNKIRILVTHRISILPQVDQIVVLKNGTISECGTFDELIAKNGYFAEFITEYLMQESDSDPENEDKTVIKKLKQQMQPLIDSSIEESIRQSISGSTNSLNNTRRLITRKSSSILSVKSSKYGKQEESIQINSKSKIGCLIDNEKAETGSVKLQVYKNYIKLIGYAFSAVIIISSIISNVSQVLAGLWLNEWSNDALNSSNYNNTNLRNIRLGVYAGIGILDAVFNLIANISVSLGCINASKLLHNIMLKRIIKAPMHFFDTTPNGRIMNRFSRDLDTADVSLVFNLRMTILQFFRIIVTFVMISLETPLVLAVVFPISVIYYLIQQFFIPTSRQLKRIDSITRSPIYSHFSETVNGSSSIRAYGVTEKFIQESNRRVDDNHICYYSSFTASRWLSIRLEFLGYCIVLMSTLFAVISRHNLSPGIAGLAISYSLNLTGILGMFVRSATEMESNIVSIERSIEYTETPIEAEWFNEYAKLENNWPENGNIVFSNYSTKYRDGLDMVLNKICIKIKHKEKIGIVGRTGAGKSSLTLALFRLIEPVEGTIFIDNVDIRKLGLYDLRSRITIIPQDPALFTGTLRLNLDPFNQYSDNEIWRALESAHLKTFVDSLDKGLSYQISEGGENLSVGQKQLVCLARALLRRTKILVLDEATAAIDMETDSLIQETIRKEFESSTIVTIAHRLNTIIDYDRVLVMDKGSVAEFDSPNNLLANSSSIFYSMAKEANIISIH
ncbi:multidrug resistance-associated protein 1-like [Oppia nitens]|uniref:multidrug resistance-associated protein 1-like n=1 Tax=Oppia nitens TaxID=1686743 RepID=UPI0023D9C94D|nr:multidrug resistance-associated protein 1-like [Oppia nitens]